MSKLTYGSSRDNFEKNYQWKSFVRRISPPLWRNLEHLGFVRETLMKNNGFDMFMSWKSETNLHCVNADEHAQVLKMLNEKIRGNPDLIDEHSKRCYDLCDDYLAFCTHHDTFEGFGNTELKNIFQQYINKNNAMVAYRPLILMLDKINATLLEEELAKEGNPEFHFEWITTNKVLAFVEERDKVIAIGKEMKALGLNTDSVLPEFIEEQINQHIAEFGWLFTHHFLGEPMTRKDVLMTLKKEQSDYDPEKMEAENEIRRVALNKIKAISPKIERYIKNAQDYAYLRTYRIDVATEGDFYFRVCFNEIAKRIGVSYDDFLQLITSEIIDWLEEKVSTDYLLEKIAQRKEYFVCYLINNNEMYWFDGKEHYIPEDKKERPKSVLLKGKVAQRGKISGKAKIVFAKEECDKVNEGDILIAPMTTPEMMTAIMKCAGIVTDEGGVASHAAQISREFGIPCVIGTGEATVQLHDDDVVEIVAEGINGTVERL
jgi:phosphohistidine swiveling domain-containing protein